MTFFATFAIRNYSEESVGKLVMFAVAVLCVAAVSNGIIAAVKEPVGRMRYRAMNCEAVPQSSDLTISPAGMSSTVSTSPRKR